MLETRMRMRTVGMIRIGDWEGKDCWVEEIGTLGLLVQLYVGARNFGP
jgi:hypothetical protein